MRTIKIASTTELGGALRTRAESLGYHQTAVGAMVGLERSEVAKVYAGKYKKHTHYKAIARALGTTVEAISTSVLWRERPDIGPDAHVIAVASLKGGTGKSMTAAHLAGGLARRGFRVLLVDLDDSCQVQQWLTDFDIEDVEDGPTLMDVLCRRSVGEDSATTEHTIYPSLIEGLDLVRSSEEILKLEIELSMKTATERRLIRALSSVKQDYDFVVIDTAPALDLRLKMALMAADSMLIPMKPTDTDLDRFYRFIPALMEFVQDPDLNPDLQLLGVLLCEFTSEGAFEREIKQALEEEYPGALFPTPIRKYKAYGQLLSKQKLIYTHKPDLARDYNALVQGCIDRICPDHDVEEVSA